MLGAFQTASSGNIVCNKMRHNTRRHASLLGWPGCLLHLCSAGSRSGELCRAALDGNERHSCNLKGGGVASAALGYHSSVEDIGDYGVQCALGIALIPLQQKLSFPP